ncbi:hypothetical protein ACWEWX_47070, partial [Streptomyces asiaticus]
TGMIAIGVIFVLLIGEIDLSVAFTGGDYGCPAGAPELARIIAETAIEVLLDRVPDLTLAVEPEELEWVDSLWCRAPSSLPVTFTPTHINAG